MNCCELLSELYFYLAFAVKTACNENDTPLWIAFRIVFLLGIRSWRNKHVHSLCVVNCFQNCIFTWHSQLIQCSTMLIMCCELLSELYFYLAFAVSKKICKRLFCCELLSELYFYLAFAVLIENHACSCKLWIAFRIVFLLGIRS